jgi:hypothetical protein
MCFPLAPKFSASGHPKHAPYRVGSASFEKEVGAGEGSCKARGGVTAVLPSVSLCEFCSSGAALLPAPPACLQESTGAGRAFFFHPSTLPQCSKFRQPTSLPLFTSPAPRQAGCASFRFLPGLCSLCFSAAKQTCFRRFGLRCA